MPDGERIQHVAEQALLTIGEGAINPDDRPEISNERISNLCEELKTDKYYEAIDTKAISNCCVDGRCGNHNFGPNAAGGTTSLVAAEALAEGPGVTSFRNASDNMVQHANQLFTHLQKDFRIGGHTGPNASESKSDCGAQDRFDEILGYISRRGDDVRGVIESLQVPVSDDLHARITDNADKHANDGYVVSGPAIKQTFEKVAGDECVVALEGSHKEVAVVINTKAGQTLNREKMQADHGDDMQVFNLDVAGLLEGCRAVSESEAEAQMKLVAGLYYNVATAAVLAGPSLRVVVR